ncbi:hypothetical protein JOB18_039410 [Solea senegalensis]|uniref:Uncharacterized protein n=1 Tax=Solea senegalensis TaxID=28829 RepID=A0AAV6SC02_SOLSE|nr:hypothetical protein JOB18_039410 [Solea senegalensis]
MPQFLEKPKQTRVQKEAEPVRSCSLEASSINTQTTHCCSFSPVFHDHVQKRLQREETTHRFHSVASYERECASSSLQCANKCVQDSAEQTGAAVDFSETLRRFVNTAPFQHKKVSS